MKRLSIVISLILAGIWFFNFNSLNEPETNESSIPVQEIKKVSKDNLVPKTKPVIQKVVLKPEAPKDEVLHLSFTSDGGINNLTSRDWKNYTEEEIVERNEKEKQKLLGRCSQKEIECIFGMNEEDFEKIANEENAEKDKNLKVLWNDLISLTAQIDQLEKDNAANENAVSVYQMIKRQHELSSQIDALDSIKIKVWTGLFEECSDATKCYIPNKFFRE